MRTFLKIAMASAMLAPLTGLAQKWEVGLFAGGSNYSGDLSPAPVTLGETNPAFGGILRYNTSKNITLKGNIYYGAISGTDENSEKEKNRQRNLSFKSNVLDIGFNMEVNLLGWQPGNKKQQTTPYLFLGISLFKFDPQAIDPATGEYVRLQPLGTEGQETTVYNDRRKYALTQISLPFGAGLKVPLSDHWNFGLELGFRKTFTDYLDDVSSSYVEYGYLAGSRGELSARMMNRTGEVLSVRNEFTDKDLRGNPTNKDWYMFAGIILSYNIMSKPCYYF